MLGWHYSFMGQKWLVVGDRGTWNVLRRHVSAHSSGAFLLIMLLSYSEIGKSALLVAISLETFETTKTLLPDLFVASFARQWDEVSGYQASRVHSGKQSCEIILR